ncbi:MAG: hypothetical protein ACJAW1_002479 [Glaciecola sp.]|jgi:hypothetical protein
MTLYFLPDSIAWLAIDQISFEIHKGVKNWPSVNSRLAAKSANRVAFLVNWPFELIVLA